jgi:hypothetical protein
VSTGHSRHREEEFLKFMQLIETRFPGCLMDAVFPSHLEQFMIVAIIDVNSDNDWAGMV